MNSVSPDQQRVAEDRFKEIEASKQPFYQEIEKWRKRQSTEPVAIKVVELLEKWLQMKEVEQKLVLGQFATPLHQESPQSSEHSDPASR